MRSLWLLTALLVGSPAAAAGLPELEAAFSRLRSAVLSAPPLGGAFPLGQLQAPLPPRRLTDEVLWARLVARVRSAPTLTQDLHAGESDFKVYIVLLERAVAGQACAQGAKPRLAFYLAQTVKGRGGEVYPARLTFECVSSHLTQLGFAVDADENGFIKDELLFDPAAGRILNPPKNKLSAAQRAGFDASVADAVRLLLP